MDIRIFSGEMSLLDRRRIHSDGKHCKSEKKEKRQTGANIGHEQSDIETRKHRIRNAGGTKLGSCDIIDTRKFDLERYSRKDLSKMRRHGNGRGVIEGLI
jgi:hypothetical protein